MFEKEAEEYAEKKICQEYNDDCMGFDKCKEYCERYHNTQKYWKDGAEFGYNKAKESHSPDEHIDKDRVVLGIIKHCNKIRYSLVQWNGEWWYQYGTYNAEVRLIAWYNIPELPKEVDNG